MKESLFDKIIDFHEVAPLLAREIKTMKDYRSECDDGQGIVNVIHSIDGDAHLLMESHPRADLIGDPSFRARTFFGGGRQERVRIALLLLALAIQDDHDPEIPTL